MSYAVTLSGKTMLWLALKFVMIAVLALSGLTDASVASDLGNNNNIARLEAYDLPAIQWACEPYLDATRNIKENVNEADLRSMKEKTRDLCMKLRAGKTEHSNSSIEETRLENDKEDIEINSKESYLPSAATTITEIEELPSEGSHRAPSAAPSSSTTDRKDYSFSVFQKGDGHETDPDGIPSRYMKMQGDRRDLAKAALENTLKWREENEVDTLLARPHPKFDVSKAVFPHYFCGRDDTQHVILVQRPGLMNVDIAHKNDLSGEDLLMHYVYVMEYLWRIIDPEPDATMTSIIDLTGLNISILRKREQLRIGSLFLSTMDAHFPQRSYRTYLINAPRWFGAVYKLATPLLRESTKEKIQILSKGKEQDQVLDQLLRDCPIPEGEKRENVPPGIMEEEMRNFCLARLEEAGMEMQLVESV